MDTQALALPTATQPRARDTRSVSGRVTGRLKQALDAMVWEGQTDTQAAVNVGFNVLSIRLALQKPHVRAYYRQQIEVLRARESSRNIHALVEVRDQLDNQMARVNAVKALEQLADQPQARGGSQQSAGLVIVINGGAQIAQQRDAAANPLIEHEPVISAQSNRNPSQP